MAGRAYPDKAARRRCCIPLSIETALGLVMGIGLPLASLIAPAASAGTVLPEGGEVVSGSATITPGADRVDVHQSSQKAILHWGKFSIGPDGTVQFHTPGGNAITINRVIGDDPSEIFGKLISNGQLVLLNQNGILFGPGSKVDVAGLLASTATANPAMLAEGLEAGKLVLDQAGAIDASIINQGEISVAETGYAALVAPHVHNEGVIAARLGTVVLQSGETATIDLHGDGMITFAMAPSQTPKDENGNQRQALVENTGRIEADGGVVLMAASGIEDVVTNVINNEGYVRANAVQKQGGRVTFSAIGGGVALGGEVRAETPAAPPAAGAKEEPASGADESAGAGVITVRADSAEVTGTISTKGSGKGRIDIATLDDLTADQAEIEGGKIALTADHDEEGRGKAEIRATTITARDDENRKGGEVEITGQEVTLADATRIDADGAQGGGTIHIGGDWQGKGELRVAETVAVDDSVTLSVDAEQQGDGGEIVAFARDHAIFTGSASARGGAEGGDGGRVETSGLNTVDYVGARIDTLAPLGETGLWLVDPVHETIDAATAATIASQTTNYSLSASGTITISAPITMTHSGIGLSFTAGEDVRNYETITTQGGNVSFTATDRANVYGNIVTNGGSFSATAKDFKIGSDDAITTSGGSITVSVKDKFSTSEDLTTGEIGTLNAGTGNIVVTNNTDGDDTAMFDIDINSPMGSMTISNAIGAEFIGHNISITTQGNATLTQDLITLSGSINASGKLTIDGNSTGDLYLSNNVSVGNIDSDNRDIQARREFTITGNATNLTQIILNDTTGVLKIASGAQLTTSGIQGGSLVLADDAILNATDISLTGDITSTGTTEIASSGQISAGKLVADGNTNLAAFGKIDLTSGVENTGGWTLLTTNNSGGDIVLGADATSSGYIKLDAAGRIDVDGKVKSTTGNTILYADSTIDVDGKVKSTTGDAILYADSTSLSPTTPSIKVSGPINAGGGVLVDGKGAVNVTGAVTAPGDIDITAGGNTDLQGRVASTSGYVSISAQNGSAVLLGDEVKADTTLSITATSTLSAANTLEAGGNVILSSIGATSLDETVTSTGGGIQITATGGGALTAKKALSAQNDMILTADGAIDLQSSLESSAGAIQVEALNTGTVTVAGPVTAETMLKLHAGGDLTTQGALTSTTDQVNVRANNSGDIALDQDITAGTRVVANAGGALDIGGVIEAGSADQVTQLIAGGPLQPSTGTLTVSAAAVDLGLANDASLDLSLTRDTTLSATMGTNAALSVAGPDTLTVDAVTGGAGSSLDATAGQTLLVVNDIQLGGDLTGSAGGLIGLSGDIDTLGAVSLTAGDTIGSVTGANGDGNVKASTATFQSGTIEVATVEASDVTFALNGGRVTADLNVSGPVTVTGSVTDRVEYAGLGIDERITLGGTFTGTVTPNQIRIDGETPVFVNDQSAFTLNGQALGLDGIGYKLAPSEGGSSGGSLTDKISSFMAAVTKPVIPPPTSGGLDPLEPLPPLGQGGASTLPGGGGPLFGPVLAALDPSFGGVADGSGIDGETDSGLGGGWASVALLNEASLVLAAENPEAVAILKNQSPESFVETKQFLDNLPPEQQAAIGLVITKVLDDPSMVDTQEVMNLLVEVGGADILASDIVDVAAEVLVGADPTLFPTFNTPVMNLNPFGEVNFETAQEAAVGGNLPPFDLSVAIGDLEGGDALLSDLVTLFDDADASLNADIPSDAFGGQSAIVLPGLVSFEPSLPGEAPTIEDSYRDLFVPPTSGIPLF